MERPKSLLQYNASLQRLKALNVSKLYTGHGGEITEIGDLVDDRLERQKQRALKVYDLLVKPQTNFELTAQLFERLYHQQLGLTLSETLGQLDYLIDNEMIEANMRDGVIYYSRL